MRAASRDAAVPAVLDNCGHGPDEHIFLISSLGDWSTWFIQGATCSTCIRMHGRMARAD